MIRFKQANYFAKAAQALLLSAASSSVWAQALLPSPKPAPAQQMASSDPLAKLRPLQLPEAVSGMPAPGWWILAGLVIAASVAAFMFWRSTAQTRAKRRNNKRQRQDSIALFQALSLEPKAEFIADTNRLLKRVAVRYYPAQQPGKLQGAQWVNFLKRSCPTLDVHALSLLEDGPYLPAEQLGSSSLAPLQSAALQWLREHREPQDV